MPNELQELHSEGNFPLPDRQLPLKDSTLHAEEVKCPRLGTKRCLSVPTVVQAGAFVPSFTVGKLVFYLMFLFCKTLGTATTMQ